MELSASGLDRLHFSRNASALAAFCTRNHIRTLSLFGSVLREDFRADSDVDILVEFDPDQVPGFAFFTMEQELTEMIGRSVDLHTPKSLSRYFRERVQAEAEPLYVRR